MNGPASADELVATGIPALGELPWGTHVCHLHGAGDDLRDTLVPYFKTGLLSGERCVWIASAPLSAEAARRALRAEIPDLDELEGRGQLEIIDESSRPVQGQTFVGDWVRAEHSALARGFRGLRISGDTGSLCRDSTRAFADYEAACHASLSGLRVVVICRYSMDEFSLSDLLEALTHHGFALVRRRRGWEIVHCATELVDAIAARDGQLARDLEVERRARRRRDDPTPVPRFGALRARDNPSRRLAHLQRVALSLSEVRSLEQLAPVVARDVRAVVGGPMIQLVVATSDQELSPVAGAGRAVDAAERISVDSPEPAADAYRDGPVWLEDPRAIERRYGAHRGAVALAALPIRLADRLLGAAVFAYPQPRVFDGARRALLWDIAYQLALTIDRARAYEDAERERRRAEHASESKDAFMAMLGHELRNPLAAIKNAAELLRMTDTPEKLERAQAVIERQSEHMTRLIDGLLDVSRIVRGKVSIAAEPLDACEIVKEAVEGRLPQIERRGLVLALDLEEGGLWIRGDRVRMTQIIDNLLSNAIDFSQRGDPLSLRAKARGGVAMIQVRDAGAGIEREVLPHIFEPFQQANRDTDRTTGGLGLGLALVKGLVELHGGSVVAHSEGPGRGSLFTVRVPLSTSQRASEPLARYVPASPRRVLIVEDHSDAAQVLSDVLREAGHETVVASDGESAVETSRRFGPDAVFCDIDLPGPMSGHDVARAIRKEADPGGPLLVALSGYGRPDDIQRAKAAGFQAHLTKPISLDAVHALFATHRPAGATR